MNGIEVSDLVAQDRQTAHDLESLETTIALDDKLLHVVDSAATFSSVALSTPPSPSSSALSSLSSYKLHP